MVKFYLNMLLFFISLPFDIVYTGIFESSFKEVIKDCVYNLPRSIQYEYKKARGER